MIKKFEEYIHEGLWSKGIERSKTNTFSIPSKIMLKVMEHQDKFFEYVKNTKLK